ncbi:MAG: hypothetical protein M3544_15005 [Pseudomonadota bacterium]|nr:hypothetical protein [Pseudomonadota bacterium]
MTRLGLLLTLTEPPPAMEEEFNAWYDEEHLPERLSIPGFRSAQRWVADVAPGEGKYLATYELDSAAVLSSPAYLERFRNQTPWSKRCLGKTVVFKRWVCEQVDPGGAGPHPLARAVMLEENLSFPGLLQVRRFAAESGEKIVLAELAQAPVGARVYRSYR